MKLEEVKYYDKINLEGGWYPWPEDVTVFVKELLPYLKELEEKIASLEKRIEHKKCEHTFVSSVAYKGAMICTKCNLHK